MTRSPIQFYNYAVRDGLVRFLWAEATESDEGMWILRNFFRGDRFDRSFVDAQRVKYRELVDSIDADTPELRIGPIFAILMVIDGVVTDQDLLRATEQLGYVKIPVQFNGHYCGLLVTADD